MDDEDGARRAPAGLPRARVRNDERRVLPLPAHAAHESPSPTGGKGLRVTPNKNRLVQVRRAGGRKLFDRARRETFLEWFAATCNVRLAAEKAGICYSAVFRHRMKDDTFAEAWDRALAQGYARIEARLLQEVMPPLPARGGGAMQRPSTSLGTNGLFDGRDGGEGDAPSTSPRTDGSFDGRGGGEEDGPSTLIGTDGTFDGRVGALPTPAPPCDGGEEFEVRGDLDSMDVEGAFDPQLAMQLLREHARRLPGAADKRKAQRTTARAASNKEIAAALVKRLRAFSLRTQASRHSQERESR